MKTGKGTRVRKQVRHQTAENDVAIILKNIGWRVFKKGMPDFFCIGHDGSWMFVEAKRSENDLLSDEQSEVVDAMEKAGLAVYIAYPSQESGELVLAKRDTSDPGRIIKVQTFQETDLKSRENALMAYLEKIKQ